MLDVPDDVANHTAGIGAGQSGTKATSLHGHLKNEGEGTNGREEELGSSSYVNPDKAKDTQLVYALDFLRGVESLASDAAKKRAEDN